MIDRRIVVHDYETLDIHDDDEADVVTERYPTPFPDALAATLGEDLQAARDDDPTLEAPVPDFAPPPPAREVRSPRVPRSKTAKGSRRKG
jgi:hypothetical protein